MQLEVIRRVKKRRDEGVHQSNYRAKEGRKAQLDPGWAQGRGEKGRSDLSEDDLTRKGT